MKIPFKLYRFFRIWRLEYLANKAKMSLDSLRKFTAGHVMEHPYSIVMAKLQDNFNEVQLHIVMLETAVDWEQYNGLLFDYEEIKATEKFDAFMKEADDFLRNLGPAFQEKLNQECEGALEEWFNSNKGSM